MRAIYVDKDLPRALAVIALKGLSKRVIFGPLSPVRFEDLPEPPLPGPRWVRVENRLCGICGTDLSLLYLRAHPMAAPLALPGHGRVFLGHEVVGVVTEAGPEVTRVKVGERVLMDTRFQGATCRSQELEEPCPQCERGNFALCEKASLGVGPRGVGGGFGDGFTAHESEVRPVGDGLTDEQAILAEPMSTALRAVLRRRPAPGDRVLVVGGGIIGLSVIQCLRAVEPRCYVTAFVRHPHQEVAAHRMGAHSVFLPCDRYEATYLTTGARIYEGAFGNRMALGGFEAVYDCAGTARSLGSSLRYARAGGAVVLVGITFAPLRLDLSPIWYQEVDVLGVHAHGAELWEGERRQDMDIVMELMSEGRLSTEGLVTHRFPLERWREAMATAKGKRGGVIKVALDYR